MSKENLKGFLLRAHLPDKLNNVRTIFLSCTTFTIIISINILITYIV